MNECIVCGIEAKGETCSQDCQDRLAGLSTEEYDTLVREIEEMREHEAREAFEASMEQMQVDEYLERSWG